MPHLNTVLWGNTFIVWLVTVATVLALLGLFYLARQAAIRYFTRLLGKGDAQVDHYLITLAAGLKPALMAAVSLSLASRIPDLPDRADHILGLLGPLALVAQTAVWGHATIAFWVEAPFKEARGKDPIAATRASVMGFFLRLLMASALLLVALSLLGFNITALVASLGLGGIAVALAVQNILGDVFASLSIALDKPFIVGDFIQVDEFLGLVEYVGLKTTRIHSLSGEQLIFSNTDLLKSRIHNYMRMPERRVLFTFGLAWDTAPEHLEALPLALQEIIQAQAGTRFDRAHLKEFKDATFTYEVVYYVLGSDYNIYMDIQQAINFALYRLLRAQGVALAAPRRAVVITEP